MSGRLQPDLQQLDERDDHAALDDQQADQPFHQIGLQHLYGGLGLVRRGYDIGLRCEVAVQQCDMFFVQRLNLLLDEAAVGQALDEAVRIERDGLGHNESTGSAPADD
ncbi:MAG: hypothetical protein OXI95_09340 [bacterium]|nr:hypothetical protein [bacterium]